MAKSDIIKFDFMAYRKYAAILSIVLVLASIGSLAINQLNFGLDFTGGSLVEVEYPQAVSPDEVRRELVDAGFEGHVVQYFGSDRDILIRMPPQKSLSDIDNADLGNKVIEALQEYDAGVERRRSEFVGPAVGEELAENGGLGMLAALGMVMVYIAFRFQLKFAFGAVVALFHDVLINPGRVFDIPLGF